MCFYVDNKVVFFVFFLCVCVAACLPTSLLKNLSLEDVLCNVPLLVSIVINLLKLGFYSRND